MIVTVTANLALDVTYSVDSLRPGTTHRVRTVRKQAGGKGVNVARLLSQLGHPTLILGLAGGLTGQQAREDLLAAGLNHQLVPMPGETRQTLTVVAGGDATVFSEPGSLIDDATWTALEASVSQALIDGATVLVCSGSLPPGAPADGYATLVRLARAHHVPVVVDAEGEPLLQAAKAGADLVKPNAAELTFTTGLTDHRQAAQSLRESGATAVAVSLGANGIYAVTAHGTWRARPPHRAAGNPTGAGDAAVAAFAAGIAGSATWPDLLRHAIALSAAAVAAPVAGAASLAVYHRLLPEIRVEEIDATQNNR
jgi:tagatose 6-phosphate kinase